MYSLKPKHPVNERRFGTCLDVSNRGNVMAVVENGDVDTICRVLIYKRGEHEWHVRSSIDIHPSLNGSKVEVPVGVGVSETGDTIVLTTNIGYCVYTQERARVQWAMVAIRAYPSYMYNGTQGLSVTVSKTGDYAMLTTNSPHRSNTGVTVLVISKSTGYRAGPLGLQTQIHAPSNTYVCAVMQSPMVDNMFAVQVTAHTPTRRSSSSLVVCSHKRSTICKHLIVPVKYRGYSTQPKPSVSKERDLVVFLDTDDSDDWIIRVHHMQYRGVETRIPVSEYFTPTGTVITNANVSIITLHGIYSDAEGRHMCLMRLRLNVDHKVLSTQYIDTGEVMGRQDLHQAKHGMELVCSDPTESTDATHSGIIQIHTGIV